MTPWCSWTPCGTRRRSLCACYLFGLTNGGANTHARSWDSPRYACWYAIGLVARNQGDDVAKAEKIFRTVSVPTFVSTFPRLTRSTFSVSYQYTDPTKIWYGTFADPEAPDVTTVANPLIYTNYDPNVRGFVTTSLIILLEEYEDRLSKGTVKLLEESMYNATVGDGYRVGGWYGDNLYPVYSNRELFWITSPFPSVLTNTGQRGSCVASKHPGYVDPVPRSKCILIRLWYRSDTAWATRT